jgi:hypothetical protein
MSDVRPWLRLGVLLGALAGGTASRAVAQGATASPPMLVFSGITGAASPPAKRVATTIGTAWQLKGQLAPWLSVLPASGAGRDSLTVAVNGAGLAAGTYSHTIQVNANDDSDSLRIPVVFRLRDGGGATFTSYEVELTFVGYTGLIQGAPNCTVNQNGYDRLVGTVSGDETPATDEDVDYVGTLLRVTAIDFCETKGRKGPGDDERAWCTVTLSGYAVTDVELTVYGEADRGAWLKASPATGPVSRNVHGGCDAQETNQIRSDYPGSSDGGGGSPNGQPIDDVKATDPQGRPVTFFVNGLARLRPGTYPSNAPQGGWTLRVIRKVP